MKERFEIILLDDASEFLKHIDKKASKKMLYNIRKSKYFNNPEIFKKLTYDIWEFRTIYNRQYYRLFSFWDKTEKTETLVIATHGLIKKTRRIPKNEIDKAEKIMKAYFDEK